MTERSIAEQIAWCDKWASFLDAPEAAAMFRSIAETLRQQEVAMMTGKVVRESQRLLLAWRRHVMAGEGVQAEGCISDLFALYQNVGIPANDEAFVDDFGVKAERREPLFTWIEWYLCERQKAGDIKARGLWEQWTDYLDTLPNEAAGRRRATEPPAPSVTVCTCSSVTGGRMYPTLTCPIHGSSR